MNITAFCWYAFKFLVLPLGLYLGILMHASSMSDLSAFITGYIMNQAGLTMSLNSDTYVTVVQVLTSPIVLMAWLVPEGSSVLMGAMAITGQIGFFVVLTLLCWSVLPPRFIINKSHAGEEALSAGA